MVMRSESLSSLEISVSEPFPNFFLEFFFQFFVPEESDCLFSEDGGVTLGIFLEGENSSLPVSSPCVLFPCPPGDEEEATGVLAPGWCIERACLMIPQLWGSLGGHVFMS